MNNYFKVFLAMSILVFISWSIIVVNNFNLSHPKTIMICKDSIDTNLSDGIPAERICRVYNSSEENNFTLLNFSQKIEKPFINIK